MNVELLRHPPISGSIPERWFDAVGSCAWVRFEPASAPAWAGVFGAGDIVETSAVAPFADDRHALVIARGIGYVVDAETGSLKYRTNSDLLVNAVSIPQRSFVIASSWSRLFALGVSGELWSQDVALDGIEFQSATPSTLRGEVWQGSGWHAFTLDYNGWQYREHGAVHPHVKTS